MMVTMWMLLCIHMFWLKCEGDPNFIKTLLLGAIITKQ
jgi:hypothetical protein